jgi:hypothetical protein
MPTAALFRNMDNAKFMESNKNRYMEDTFSHKMLFESITFTHFHVMECEMTDEFWIDDQIYWTL